MTECGFLKAMSRRVLLLFVCIGFNAGTGKVEISANLVNAHEKHGLQFYCVAQQKPGLFASAFVAPF